MRRRVLATKCHCTMKVPSAKLGAKNGKDVFRTIVKKSIYRGKELRRQGEPLQLLINFRYFNAQDNFNFTFAV